jgi:two-component system sensor histidine kinase SenX3
MAQMLYQTKRLNDNLMQLLALYKGRQARVSLRPCSRSQRRSWSSRWRPGRVLLQSRGITLDLDFAPDLIWHLDEDLIVGVLSHAINNAIHYTRDRIRLSIRSTTAGSNCASRTTAPAIPALLKPARCDGAPAPAVNFITNSAGLGLYFSSEVAKMHRHRGAAAPCASKTAARWAAAASS